MAARALYTCRVLFRVQPSHAASHAQIFHGDVIFCLAFEPHVRDSDSANVPERIVTGCRDGNLRVRGPREHRVAADRAEWDYRTPCPAGYSARAASRLAMLAHVCVRARVFGR